MNRYTAHEFDNRDSSQMYEYLEARIEVMKRRITELDMENQDLRQLREPYTETREHVAGLCYRNGPRYPPDAVTLSLLYDNETSGMSLAIGANVGRWGTIILNHTSMVRSH